MFRIEMDALNAIYKEQQRTNELLEQLIKSNMTTENIRPVEPLNKPKRQRGKAQ